MSCPECGGYMAGGGYLSACHLRHCGCHSCLACGECAIAICDDCLDATGGVCARHQRPDCTCYELTGGHQPGCAFNGRAP